MNKEPFYALATDILEEIYKSPSAWLPSELRDRLRAAIANEMEELGVKEETKH